MISTNDVIVVGCVALLFLGILRLSPRLWKAKATILIALLLFLVSGAGIAYGAFLFWQYKNSPKPLHTWNDGESYDLEGNPIDQKQYR